MGRQVAVFHHLKCQFRFVLRQDSGFARGDHAGPRRSGFPALDFRKPGLGGLPRGFKSVFEPLDGGVPLFVRGRRDGCDLLKRGKAPMAGEAGLALATQALGRRSPALRSGGPRDARSQDAGPEFLTGMGKIDYFHAVRDHAFFQRLGSLRDRSIAPFLGRTATSISENTRTSSRAKEPKRYTPASRGSRCASTIRRTSARYLS